MSRPTLHDDGIGGKGFTVSTLAWHWGVSKDCITRLCREGMIEGAAKHPKTLQWWVYPPAKLLCNPRKTGVGGSTVSSSTSPAIVLV